MKNIFKKKCTDLTLGESLWASLLITAALAPICFIPYGYEKLQEWKANRKRK